MKKPIHESFFTQLLQLIVCVSVIIYASDTDIVVMALFHFKQLRKDGHQELLIQSKDHYIPVHELVHEISETKRKMRPLLHAISGCDTNGFVFGKGKFVVTKACGRTKNRI